MFLTQMIHFIMPLADDTTGISNAFIGIAKLLAAAVAGPIAVVLVVEGYQYMFADSSQRGTHVKRAIAFILGGATLVILGVTIAPLIVKAIGG